MSYKVCYILATYGGKDVRSIGFNEEPPRARYVHYHLNRLAQMDLSQVSKILLSKPHTNSLISGFYDIDSNTRKALGSKLIEINLPNEYLSYGQYVNGFKLHRDCDFYIIIEDDYLPVHPDFINNLIKCHQEKLPHGGYLCSYKSNITSFFPPHAAVSNGIIDNKTFTKEVLQYSDPMKKSREIVMADGYSQCDQVNFSYLFKDCLEDFSHRYAVPFWASSLKGLYYMTELRSPLIFSPIQLEYKNGLLC